MNHYTNATNFNLYAFILCITIAIHVSTKFYLDQIHFFVNLSNSEVSCLNDL